MKRIVLALAVVLTASTVARGQTVPDASRRDALQHLRNGQELLSTEHFEMAADEFRAAIRLDPLLTLAHYGLGQANMNLRRYESAIQAFVGCRDAYTQIARLRETNGFESDRRTEDEIRYLRDRLLAIRSRQLKGAAGGPAAEAQVESRLEELESMKRNRRFENTETAVPGEVHLALGSAYYRNGQRSDAEREWLAAVAANPRLGEANSNLAVLYMQSGRKQDAEAQIRAAEKTKFRVNPQLKADIAKMK